ncbi:phage major capsid protein [Lactiplantibacillus paraxiangfangensis]|uniref:phage major capsid protein n=1 Tax=Lactiplantibacillus paraxiangfangensis TaxID=3076224 RepID=UPI0030C6CE33
MNKLQLLFNKVSAHCADLNAQLNAKLADDHSTPEEYQKIKDELVSERARRDAIDEQLKSIEEATNTDKSKPNPPKKAGTDLTKKVKDNSKIVFHNFLKAGKVTDGMTGIGLGDGAVLIPETILPVEHEAHQFPRLGGLVRNIQVSTTTGKLPVFQDSDDKLTEHTEFSETPENKKPGIKPINWDLQTYTGRYVFSQDLISDSSYDWEGELRNTLTELRDNTDDSLIAGKLTDGITAVAVTDLITEIKHALNKSLKPMDSTNASIILSQSAYDEIDNLKDTTGRPILQPNISLGSGDMIKGRTVIVLDDLLFPNAKIGDANIIVTPLQKSIIKFKNNEITGQFQDTYDVWYKALGIYMREDVCQARPDLINWLSSSASTTTTASATK